MIYATILGMFSGLLVPRRWKFPVVSFWAVALAAFSVTTLFI